MLGHILMLVTIIPEEESLMRECTYKMLVIKVDPGEMPTSKQNERTSKQNGRTSKQKERSGH